MESAQLEAVGTDYDRRSAYWEDIYAGSSLHDRVIQRRAALALSCLAGQGRLLDIGCGAGQLLDRAASRGWAVTGLDISSAQAQRSRARLVRSSSPAAGVCRGDAGHLPLRGRSFSAVVCLGTLQYLWDPAGGIAEISRVVASGGVVVVSVPNRLRLSILADPIGALRRYLSPEHRGYRRRLFSRRSIAVLLRRHGLHPDRVSGLGFGPFSILGHTLTRDGASIGVDRWLSNRLPAAVASRLGSEIVVIAHRTED